MFSIKSQKLYIDGLLVDNNDTIPVEIYKAIQAIQTPIYSDPRLPAFVLSTNNEKIAFGIGGYVRLTSSEDFKGISDNIDFIPNQIPINSTAPQKERFIFDATTSKIFFVALYNTKFGTILGYFDTNFRGGNNANQVGSAYLSLNGFLIGRDWSILTDTYAIPPSLDSQGPNGFFGKTTEQLSYKGYIGKYFSFGAGIEIPYLSISDTLTNVQTRQITPTFPLFIRVGTNDNHFHLAGLIRPLIYRINDKTSSLFTSAIICSSALSPFRSLSLDFQAFYGNGTGNYVFDFGSNGYDAFLYDNRLIKVREFGATFAVQYQVNERLKFSGIYSYLKLFNERNMDPFFYRTGRYVAASVFFKVTKKFEIAGEYNRGIHQLQNGLEGRANRVQLALRYDF
ncbi:MAG: DcaP family trimeric outer membrane transporter [Bacteroidales bacterium]|nr:DcaP family trimeric outer membrane transporter [Bacteroidales bacterium]